MTHNSSSTVESDTNAPIDKTLTQFFESEVPQPWPEAPEVTVAVTRRQQGPSLWQKVGQYLSIAVVLALLMFGYYTLGGQFPTNVAEPESPTHPAAKYRIGMNPDIPNQPVGDENNQ